MESSSLHFGLASQDLLDKIDQLFACNVGEYVDLPQLVVVGDQSSGKSSVLAALTKLPFPRESNLCTRFATQITFRRTQETHVTASVIPAQDTSEEHASKVRGWTKNDLQSLDVKSFADIMRQVCRSWAIAQANFLLEVELSGTPATLNHYFNDNLQKWSKAFSPLFRVYPNFFDYLTSRRRTKLDYRVNFRLDKSVKTNQRARAQKNPANLN